MASNIFNTVLFPKVQSNVFDMSYDFKLSLNMGELTPIHCQEIVPGDKISMSSQSLLRFAPMIAPVMHKIDVYQHFFFVPNRLTWSGWEDFITDKKPAPAFPYIPSLVVSSGSLADYLGLPLSDTGIDRVSALPFAAYQMVYNEYYRDQNLVEEIDSKLLDGANMNPDLTSKRRRAWQHDYFTSALPFAQKGEAVEIPLAPMEDVAVYLDPNRVPGLDGRIVRADGGEIDGTSNVRYVGSGLDPAASLLDQAGNKVIYDPEFGLKADTSSLNPEPTTINDLRRAFKLQEWLEKNARGGTRYVENILSHFGVRSSDARLQRPQYLGGSKQPVVISEVLQTAEGTETPQGNMAGHGVSVGGGKNFSFTAEEHGYIIGIMSVMPKTAYQQGIPKHFSKSDRLDFYWPSFAHLGEQEVKNRELYYDGNESSEVNDATFGYVPRYSEYKYHDARVAGDFRDNLSFWHLGRVFRSRPHLNQDFIECHPSQRIFAVEADDVDKIYAHVFHEIKAVRKMPKYGIPTF